MNTRRNFLLAAPFLVQACASIRPGPTAEQRAAIAPTGTLRVGLNLGSPLSLVSRRSGLAQRRAA